MSGSDPQGLYQALGIDPSASAEDIKSAYRRLAKETHPDTSANASTEKFQRISAAYEVLGDPQKRAHYDSATYQASTQEAEEHVLDPICCSRCGQVTAQPRHVVFFRVYSYIVGTTRTPVQGIFCASCAKKEGLKSSIITLFTGWWGVPWGPIYSIGSILSNGFGGKHDQAADERLLWYNTLAFLSRGNLQLAYALATLSKRTRDKEISKNAADLAKQLENAGADSRQAKLRNPWKISALYGAGHLLMAFALPGTIGLLIYADSQRGPPHSDYGYTAANIYSAPPSSIQYNPAMQKQPAKPSVPTCVTLPFNGKLLGPNQLLNSGGHSLEIRNGSSGNAIIKLREEFSRTVVAAFYVSSNQTAQIEGIPDGRYRVQYAFGDALDATCNSFVELSGAGQFPQAEALETERTATQIVTQVLTYTLYAVPAGNVTPQHISVEEFDR